MFKIFSVDDHIIEPADLWTSRLPAGLRAEGPHVVEEDGREFWEYEDQRVLTIGLNAVAGHPRGDWDSEPTRFGDMIPGCYDPKERAREMLSQGVLASVCFPTMPRFGGMLFNSFKDKALADVCVQAWNDFVLDEWCPGGPPGMFVPMIICQTWDPALAAAEIARCVDKGAKALCFVENPVPDGLPGFHTDHWNPIWRAVTDARIPVCMHIASSGYVPMPDPKAPVATLISLFNMCGMLAMVNLLLSPVCHQFPDIQIAFSEAGIGWIPAILERADRQCDRHRSWAGPTRELRPSEIFARNMYACMVEEPIGLSFYEQIGVDRILSETDYPHSDSPYPHIQKAYEEVFAGIPTDVIEAVSYGNAERLFKWKMADEKLLDSPDVQSWRATLEEDPTAALQTRHSVEGVIRASQQSGAPTTLDLRPGDPCPQLVVKSAGYTKCGETIGQDGRCEAGHDVLVIGG